MLDDLVQAIETLKQRIREHRTYVGAHESRTRVSLIDPMLSALGWDVSNPALVQIETRTTNGWADYALLGIDGRPVIFVEAKKLTEEVGKHVQQTVGYAVSENMGGANVPYCACTNGDNWEVFNIFTQKLILKASISTEDAARCALQFLGLWRRTIANGGFVSAVEPVTDPVDIPTPPPDHISPPPPPPEWTPLPAGLRFCGNHAPSEIWFPDGNPTPLRYWRDILMQTALWLTQTGDLTKDKCPFPMGPKRNLFSLDGSHRSGTPFNSVVAIGSTGIKMEGHLDSKTIVKLTQQLLHDFGKDPSQVKLKFQ